MATPTGTINPSTWKTFKVSDPIQQQVFINQLVQYLQDGTKANNNAINTLNNEVAALTPAPPAVLVFLTAAYNAVAADSNKYFVCSGGSWSLGLPAPATGLSYRVRNDQGITGTTGTITLTPASGTIDGLASLALLPGQECTVFTDGTNWRTLGRAREVVIGTIDTTAAIASVTVLLPVGYRYFVLDWTALLGSVDNSNLYATISTNGGSTFLATGYNDLYFFNSTASAMSVAQDSNAAQWTIGGITTTLGGQNQMTLYPGSAAQPPSFDSRGHYRVTASSLSTVLYSGGSQSANGLINALKFFSSGAGNITNSFLTVKGIV